MNGAKLKKLRATGWKVRSARDFLSLTDEEPMLVELKVSLAGALKQMRAKQGLAQIEQG